jgi:hypothetical protein
MEASFYILMVYMVCFLYVNRISWISCYYRTIFLFVAFIRLLLDHFLPTHHVGLN